MHAVAPTESRGANAPGAWRMAAIAFVAFNLSMGSAFVPYGVLVAPIEHKLAVSREISTLAVPVMTFGIAILGPFVGTMVNRLSLRLMMTIGALLMAAGFALAAVANSIVLFIAAYALLISPGLSICGVVGPTTLVTRWFEVNRGRALGLATTPALMTATPLLVAYMLKDFGLAGAFGLLAALMLVVALVSLFVIDSPNEKPAAIDARAASQPSAENADESASGVFRDVRFWQIALAGGLYNAVIVMFSTQLVPFAISQGVEPTRATLLLTSYLVGTLIGTPFVGWIADRIGGARTIGLLCISLALWQGLFNGHPGFEGMILLSGLSGLQGAAMITCMGLALSQRFSHGAFARVYGLANLIGLPFAALSVPISSAVFVRFGSYDPVFFLAVAMLIVGMLLALTVGNRSAARE